MFWIWSTVMILINATTLMHKSTLSTNNFGNNHFGQKCQKQMILRNVRKLYWCLFEKFQWIEQKLENAFLVKFSIFWELQNFQKIIMEFYLINTCLWCFCDSSYYLSAGKFSKSSPKFILNLLDLKINVLK